MYKDTHFSLLGIAESKRTILQGNSRFWNPNPLGLGGETALVNETKPLKKDLIFG